MDNPETDITFISMDDIRHKLKKLKKYADTKVSDLPKGALEDFESLTNYTRLLYDTNSKNYTKYYDEVQKIFNDYVSNKPRTVGTYFTGCLRMEKNQPADKKVNQNCVISCLGQMPLPKKDGMNKSCDENVLVGQAVEGGYDFKQLNSSNSNKVVIYLEDGTFTGFNSFDLEKIKSFLPSHENLSYQLFQYSLDKQNYNDISGGEVSFQELPTRTDIVVPSSSPSTGTNKNLWIIILVFLVLLAVVFLWKMNQQ
jgi:hypothetical protein